MNKIYSLVLFCCMNISLGASAQNVPSAQQDRAPRVSLVSQEFIFTTGEFFDQCHASTMEFSSNGELLASWFAGSHEGAGDVAIYGSRLVNGAWSEPEIWADGVVNDTLGYPCWNPVLFRAKNENTIYLYYKVGPNPREWWGMVKSSSDGGRSWSSAKRLPQGILGPIKNRPYELADGTIISPSSVELSEERWVAHVEISRDQGKSWQAYPIDHASEFNAIQPSIVQQGGPKSPLQVFCRSKEGVVTSSVSSDGGKSWSKMQKTGLINPNSGTDAIAINGVYYIVYNPDIPGKDWWEGRSKLRLAYSLDQGQSWQDIYSFEDQQKGEYSYPTIIKGADGTIHVSYTYDRKNIRHFVLRLEQN